MIYIVTYCPPYAEYNNQRSIRKSFRNKVDAEQYIDEEKAKDVKQAGDEKWIGDYDIEEVEFIE